MCVINAVWIASPNEQLVTLYAYIRGQTSKVLFESKKEKYRNVSHIIALSEWIIWISQNDMPNIEEHYSYPFVNLSFTSHEIQENFISLQLHSEKIARILNR